MRNNDLGGVFVVDEDILHPDVVEVFDLPVVDGPIEGEAEGVVGRVAGTGAEAERDGGVDALVKWHLGRAVLVDADQHDEGHAASATWETITIKYMFTILERCQLSENIQIDR